MSTIYLAECVAYDITVGAAKTLYYSTGVGYTSGASDTPAHTFFDPRLEQPLNIRRDMFAPGTTRGRSKVGRGDMVLINEDGGLDALASYAFDGRAIKVYRGDDAAAFPSGFTLIWSGTMQDADLSRGRVRIRMRDNQELLDQFYQTSKYLGDNALPAGLEGVADIEGKPKPVALGLVRNISPVLVNTSRLIYQVHDGAVTSIEAVYDAGVQLVSDFTTASEVDGVGGNINAGFYGQDASSNQRVIFAGDDGNTRIYDGSSWAAGPNEFGVGDHIYAASMGDSTDGTGWAAFVLAGAGGKLYTYAQFGIGGTSRTSQFGATSIRAAIYWDALKRWVIVGDAGKISTSDDGGQTWTSRVSGSANALYALAVSRTGVMVAVGASGTLLTTTDGTTWVTQTSGAGTSDLRSVTYGGGRYVAVGDDDKVLWSTGGVAWSLATGALTVNGMAGTPLARAVAFIDGQYVAVGEEESIETSVDAVTWLLQARVEASADDFRALVQHTPSFKTFIGGFDTSQATIDEVAGPLTIASEADLLEDAIAPRPGSYGLYADGGYFRLGSSPAGQITADVTVEATAAERTAAQLWTDVLTRAGKSVLTGNVQTVSDLTTWGVSGTPLVTGGVDDPAGGSDAYMVEDDSGTGEYIEQAITFTGVAAKTVDVIFRRRNATPDSFLFRVRDTTSGSDRLVANGSWSANGVPSFSTSTGSVVEVLPERFGYWRARFLTSAVAPGNTNMARIQPASGGNLAILDVYRFYAYDQATAVSDDWNVNDVVAADNDNATVCGHWAGLEDTTFSAVLSALAESIGAWWGVDHNGVYRIGVLKDPQLETNWFTFPRTLDNAAWTKTRTTVTADDKVAPNGLVEMDLLVEDSTAGATHFLTRNIDGPLPDNELVTITFAAAGSTRTEIRASITGKDGTVSSGFVDLSDGSVGTLSGATVTVVSDRGVYRISITADIATGATTPSFAIHLSSGSETISYNGDGASGVHLWDIGRQHNVTLKIEANDMVEAIERLPAALPTFKHTVRYQKNYTVQDTGLAGGVTDPRRGVLANEYLETASTDATVQTLYLLARDDQVDTKLDTLAGATAEAARLQALRGVRRERYETVIPLDDDTEDLDLGDYVEIVHLRFQLAAGREFAVLKVNPDANRDTIALEVWG